MTAAKKYVYKFGLNVAEGNKEMKQLLGGKGANLSEMSSIGLPVPAGFTISTEACEYYSSNKQSWPVNLMESVQEGIRHIENAMEAGFGDNRNPLLISVRSGAAVSMPGMMDTVLDLGLNDQTVKGLARKTENEWFAYDCYRRFINMFGNVVMQIPHERFEEILKLLKEDRGVELDTELETDDLKELVDRYKAIYRKETGYMFPSDPQEQLERSINAVFESWNTPRAVTYRKINRIRDLKGTAVNVQAMVYGNMGDDCATGVCFTRNPSDGTNKMYGEFLINAQGEDVVAGIRTPQDINELSEEMPEMFEELVNICRRLEKHYENMQDIEFTIQHGKLYILQTRDGKRTGPAALKIAVDMVEDGLTSKENAVEKLVTPNHLDQLLHPQLDMEKIDKSEILGEGLPASPGAAVGKVVFSSDDAEEAAKNGDPVILTRVETSPDDVGGMSAAEGILTSRGGMTSHAAVVARGWGKPCVAGCGDIIINYKKKSFTNGKVTIKEGDWISLDGTKGWVLKGEKPVVKPELDKYFDTFMNWVDEFRDMKVRTNADTPEDASRAREFGAQGIGLCRTEHMFFGEERIKAMRKMIISDTADERKKALAGLLPYQKEDFIGIFEVMDGLPVTIRLLDPPLHEFLPEDDEEIEQVAEDLNIDKEDFIQRIKPLKEFNPMLGHRGCRLGITFPEITEMQVRAIIEAALELKSKGKIVVPEIMVPLIGTAEEFESQRNVIKETCMSVFEEFGEDVDYKIGTMIEIPRATLVAGKIAEKADFFSFGTNDLTQMTYGYSRDDAGKFLGHYIQEGILPDDPFQVLDVEGVGQLVSLAVKNGREKKPDLKVGICGEHGGEPNSVRFFYEEKLNYVSCSPFRVPVARLSAAQAQLLGN